MTKRPDPTATSPFASFLGFPPRKTKASLKRTAKAANAAPSADQANRAAGGAFAHLKGLPTKLDRSPSAKPMTLGEKIVAAARKARVIE